MKIDYDRPFYTQASVVECRNGQMRLRVDDGFDYEISDGYFIVKSETWEQNINKNDCLLWLYDVSGEKEDDIILALFGKKIFSNKNPPLPIQHLEVRQNREFIDVY